MAVHEQEYGMSGTSGIRIANNYGMGSASGVIYRLLWLRRDFSRLCICEFCRNRQSNAV